MKQIRSFLLIGLMATLPVASLYAQEKKTLDLTDLMKFKQFKSIWKPGIQQNIFKPKLF